MLRVCPRPAVPPSAAHAPALVVEPPHEVIRPADRTDGQEEFVSAIASRPATSVFVAQSIPGHGAPPLFRLCERRSQGALKNSHTPRYRAELSVGRACRYRPVVARGVAERLLHEV